MDKEESLELGIRLKLWRTSWIMQTAFISQEVKRTIVHRPRLPKLKMDRFLK